MTDERPPRFTTDRGLDRLTYFTDAIAAIAITLLVLPLVEPIADAANGGETAAHYLQDHRVQLASFALSFLLIARLWIAHHSIFEHVETYTNPLRWLSLGWAFTIALLPLPSAMIAQWPTEPLLVAFYIGTLTLSNLVMTAMTIVISRDPRIASKSNPISRHTLRSSILTSAEFVLALIIGTAIPKVNFFAFFILFASIPIEIILRSRDRRRRRDAA